MERKTNRSGPQQAIAAAGPVDLAMEPPQDVIEARERILSRKAASPSLPALEAVRKIWPAAKLRTARKAHKCDNPRCPKVIQPGDEYVDSGDANPASAGGFGTSRFCLFCRGGLNEQD
jgi:hypothetical protein